MDDTEAEEINETLLENRKRAIDGVKDRLPRCSNGDPKFPEDIWMAARQIVHTYEEAMPVAALIFAERNRTHQRNA